MKSQCTYRCVVLLDFFPQDGRQGLPGCLNAPTGAWCSLTADLVIGASALALSQCTYRCVVLPDSAIAFRGHRLSGLNAPTGAWCSLTASSNKSAWVNNSLNAPTGAWCSLTVKLETDDRIVELMSQCTYRCVVLPDRSPSLTLAARWLVSMHLQVRGAP